MQFAALCAKSAIFSSDNKFYIPVLGTQTREAFFTDGYAWRSQSLRDRMVRLHGIGVLQKATGRLLNLNDKRMRVAQLRDFTFCPQVQQGMLLVPACRPACKMHA